VRLILLALGLGILLVDFASVQLAGGIVFAVDYSPRGFGIVIAAGCAAIVGAFVISIHLSRREIYTAIIVTLALAIPLAIGYALYHANHPIPMVGDGFRGYLEPHTAFHQQLAIPTFVTLACVFAIFILSLDRDNLECARDVI
jgi:hypothetical protein